MTPLQNNISAIVNTAIALPQNARALIVYDRQSELARLVSEAYALVLPRATMLEFNGDTPLETLAAINMMQPGDLVALVQSGSFRLSEFRIRLELFKRSLRVIEHPHLNRMEGEEIQTYIDALAYDAPYYRDTGKALKTRIDAAREIILECPSTRLVYTTPMESARLNVGDYAGMKNIGGQFPIGEVFTEPQHFEGVNGSVELYAYGGRDFRVVAPERPLVLHIEKGCIVGHDNAPEDFRSILEEIAATEPLWVRELGFGMNRAFTKTRRVADIGSYERMCGMHLSLGQKHTIYTKPGMPKRTSKYHVDVFANTSRVLIDGEVVFENEKYTIGSI